MLIAFEVGNGIWRNRKANKRVAAIFARLAKGQVLQTNAPPAGTVDLNISAQWVESVRAWIQQTHEFLGNYSPQAAASFLHDRGGASVNYGGVSGLVQAREWYATLVSRLNNLKDIMEKPDIYL